MAHIPMFSMSAFADIMLPGLKLAGASRICEIGVEFGGMSQMLADHAEAAGGELISIDPSPKSEFVAWAHANPVVRHVPQSSHEALGALVDVDAWVIDGDHNWYTVFYELTAIDTLCRRDDKPLLAFMHDVCWPAGRRDQYYAPERIPAEFRQPYDYESGIRPGVSESAYRSGFKGEGHFAFARHEGGPRNGVKTAIEDYLAAAAEQGHDIVYAEVPAVFGLGVLFDSDAPWADELAGLLLPYHNNSLLQQMEENRLATFLTVLDWEDSGRFGNAPPSQAMNPGMPIRRVA